MIRTLPSAKIFAFGAALLAACGPTEVDRPQSAPSSGPLDVPASAIQRFDSPESIADVVDLEVLPDGRVWVMNSVAPFFVGFGSDGSVVAEYGLQGGGPEEFRMPAGFVVGGIDEAPWVLDLQRHALVRVSGPDEPWIDRPISAYPPGTLQGGRGFLEPTVRTAGWNGGVVVPHSTGSLQAGGVLAMVEAILKAELALMTPDGAQARTLVDLDGALDDPFAGFEPTEDGFPLWKRLWAVCGDHLRVYDRVQNQLRGFDRDGAETAPIELPERRIESVTATEFAQAIFPLLQAETTGNVAGQLSADDSASIAREQVQRNRSSGAQLAAYLPEWVDLRCTPSGTMWVQPVDLEGGGIDGGRSWFRLSHDGVATEVQLPVRFDAFRFTDDRIWGVARDALDVQTVAWIPLPE